MGTSEFIMDAKDSSGFTLLVGAASLVPERLERLIGHIKHIRKPSAALQAHIEALHTAMGTVEWVEGSFSEERVEKFKQVLGVLDLESDVGRRVYGSIKWTIHNLENPSEPREHNPQTGFVHPRSVEIHCSCTCHCKCH